MASRLINKFSALSVVILLHLVASQPLVGQEERGEVYVATLEGVINPLSASYVSRAVDRAERADARALVMQMDTPGGLDSSMREIIKDIVGSRIPVVVYVAPSGARAASAGMFITISAHVAAMAPGTNIGAAHPVSLGGEQQDEVMTEKVVQDAAATARSLATLRDRNADWAERAVKESVSATSEEALRLNVIDLIAPNMDNLLEKIDGRRITTEAGEVVLHLQGARRVDIPMTLVERLLHIITDPNIAYLLLSLGVIGIIAELYNPGTFISGTIGVISLVLAFVALGSLPIGWAGIGLMVLAVALAIGELSTAGFGALGVGAIAAFVVGSLLLFVPVTPVSPSLPAVRVNPWVIVLVTATFVLFFVLVIRKALQSRRMPVTTGIESLIGKHGRAATGLDPSGRVAIAGEDWTAESVEDHIEAGTMVEVVGVTGVVLQVRRSEQSSSTE